MHVSVWSVICAPMEIVEWTCMTNRQYDLHNKTNTIGHIHKHTHANTCSQIDNLNSLICFLLLCYVCMHIDVCVCMFLFSLLFSLIFSNFSLRFLFLYRYIRLMLVFLFSLLSFFFFVCICFVFIWLLLLSGQKENKQQKESKPNSWESEQNKPNQTKLKKQKTFCTFTKWNKTLWERARQRACKWRWDVNNEDNDPLTVCVVPSCCCFLQLFFLATTQKRQ